jgi:hypothetical protein
MPNDIMEFEHVIEVRPDLTIVDRDGIYAPDLLNGELIDDNWSLMNGYTGQQGGGAVMHNSEFIGGRMERDIRSTPGIYVAVVCYWDPDEDEDEDNDDNVEGWGVAYQETPLCAITNCYEYRDRQVHGKNLCATHAAELEAM